jgi:putative SOS response-associated peptidase YedK
MVHKRIVKQALPMMTGNQRRCLIPVDTFYEWNKVVGGKIPYAIGMKDDSPFVFAGLWEG